MGNCQTADAAAVVILHVDGRAERRHGAIAANQVMGSNPGHYVTAVVAVRSKSVGGNKPERYLRLLCPDETLLVGQVYKLVTFEDVLRVFGTKRRVRLSRLLTKKEAAGDGGGRGGENRSSAGSSETEEEQQQREALMDVRSTVESGVAGSSSGVLKQGHWRPSLQTIAEIGN